MDLRNLSNKINAKFLKRTNKLSFVDANNSKYPRCEKETSAIVRCSRYFMACLRF